MNFKVKAVYGTHRWALYHENGMLIDEYNSQNCALDAKHKAEQLISKLEELTLFYMNNKSK